MGSIIPCMAAQPPQLPINDPMSIPSVGDSIPKRDSYDTDEEYHIALTTWKREGVNHITSHIQSHVLSGTMTPELMERFNSEIEKINLATGSTSANASAPVIEETPRRRCNLCRKCCEGMCFVCCFPCQQMCTCFKKTRPSESALQAPRLASGENAAQGAPVKQGEGGRPPIVHDQGVNESHTEGGAAMHDQPSQRMKADDHPSPDMNDHPTKKNVPSPFTPNGAGDDEGGGVDILMGVRDCQTTRKKIRRDAPSIRRERNTQIWANEEGIAAQVRFIDAHEEDDGSLRIGMFDITNEKVISALERALDRGMRLMLITDQQQYSSAHGKHHGRLKQLFSHPLCVAATAKGRKATFAGRMHFKLAVNRKGAMMGGQNWTEAGEKFNYDMVAEFHDPSNIRKINDYFEECWKGLTTRGIDEDGCISNLIGALPEPSEFAVSEADFNEGSSRFGGSIAGDIDVPAAPQLTSLRQSSETTEGTDLARFRENFVRLAGEGMVRKFERVNETGCISIEVPPDLGWKEFDAIVDQSKGATTTDVKGSTTAKLVDTHKFREDLARHLKDGHSMLALQTMKSYQRQQLRAYGRELSPQFGEATIVFMETVMDHIWKRSWEISPSRQAAIDWEDLINTVKVPPAVRTVELAMRAQTIRMLPDASRMDRVLGLAEDRTAEIPMIIQFAWMYYTAYSNRPEQKSKMQYQYSRFLKGSPGGPAELHRTIRLIVKWGDELLRFGIKPGEIRDLKVFYERTISSTTQTNAAFTEYLSAQKENVRLDRLNDESNNNSKEWAYQLQELTKLNRKLLGEFAFQPLVDSEKSINAIEIAVLSTSLPAHEVAEISVIPSMESEDTLVEVLLKDEFVMPDPDRLRESGLAPCFNYGTPRGCPDGEECTLYHDPQALIDSGFEKTGCLNCGMIPIKSMIAHLYVSCWRSGGGLDLHWDKWAKEKKEVMLNASICRYESLKEANTKGASRRERQMKEREERKKEESLRRRVQHVGSKTEARMERVAKRKITLPGSTSQVIEKDKTRREIAEFGVDTGCTQHGFQHELQPKRRFAAQVALTDEQKADKKVKAEMARQESARTADAIARAMMRQEMNAPDLTGMTTTSFFIESLELESVCMELMNLGVAYSMYALLDSGAMSHADQPTEDEVQHPWGIPVGALAAFGERKTYDSTDAGVILIPGLTKPIIGEVLLCKETPWKKLWLGKDRCVLACLKDEDLEAIREIVETRALRLEDLDTRAYQTRMPWTLYNDLSDSLAIRRARRPGGRERDVTRQRQDMIAPGNDSFRFDDNRFLSPQEAKPYEEVDTFTVVDPPTFFESIFCLDISCVDIIEKELSEIIESATESDIEEGPDVTDQEMMGIKATSKGKGGGQASERKESNFQERRKPGGET